MNRRRPGFALVELVAAASLCGVVFCILLIWADGSRRLGRLGEDSHRLRTMGSAYHMYAAKNSDYFAALSWGAGQTPIDPTNPLSAGLTNASDQMMAKRFQMVWILRTIGERPTFPTMQSTGLVVQTTFSHLALAEEGYLRLPMRAAVSSADVRDRWVRDPLGYDMGLYQPNLSSSLFPSDVWRHPYAGGFRPPIGMLDASPIGSRAAPAGSTGSMSIFQGTLLQPRQLSLMSFPANKVMLTDSFARHFGPRLPFCTATESRLPQLMGDGNVRVNAANTANLGCNPNNGQPATLAYTPSAIEPPFEINGANWDPLSVRFLWTRRGIAGRDYNGPEVPGF